MDRSRGPRREIAALPIPSATVVACKQFSTPAKPPIHHDTPARKIWDDTEGTVDVLRWRAWARRHDHRVSR